MKKVVFMAMAIVITTGLFAQESVPEEIAEKIKITALNYGDGFLSGSGERMEQALFPDLQKLAPMQLPNDGGTVFIQSTYSGLIAMSGAKVGVIPEEQRKIEVSALAVYEDIACAKLTSSQFNDYLHMVKVGEDWKIVNVLWTFGSDSRNRSQVPKLDIDEQIPAIETVAKDLFEGVFTGDAELVEKCLIPRFSQASYNALPNGDKMIARDGFDLFLGITKGKLSLVPKENRNIKVDVLDYMDGLATVKLSSAAGTAFMHLVYLDGEWKVVNILKRNP